MTSRCVDGCGWRTPPHQSTWASSRMIRGSTRPRVLGRPRCCASRRTATTRTSSAPVLSYPRGHRGRPRRSGKRVTGRGGGISMDRPARPRRSRWRRAWLEFTLDPRIDPDLQTGNKVYKSNRLDRGHIAPVRWSSEPPWVMDIRDFPSASSHFGPSPGQVGVDEVRPLLRVDEFHRVVSVSGSVGGAVSVVVELQS
jgi:hypothetical protein